MARNIEIKALLANIDACIDKAKYFSGSDPEMIWQEDYFFNCTNGRLKLRIFSSDNGELIFYKRKNESGPKTSQYFISKTNEPNKLLDVLEKSYGIRGVVKKIRKLFLIGNTRVHIDQVEHLGNFLELEVVLSKEEDINNGKQVAQRLMEQFGIEEGSLINCAYIDLIENKFKPQVQ